MTVPPISPAQMDALASLVDAYICPIQTIPHGSTEQPPGRHHGTGWLYEREGLPFLVTCEHVSRRQRNGAVGFNCHGSDSARTWTERSWSCPSRSIRPLRASPDRLVACLTKEDARRACSRPHIATQCRASSSTSAVFRVLTRARDSERKPCMPCLPSSGKRNSTKRSSGRSHLTQMRNFTSAWAGALGARQQWATRGGCCRCRTA
jgi:hypothetical protein